LAKAGTSSAVNTEIRDNTTSNSTRLNALLRCMARPAGKEKPVRHTPNLFSRSFIDGASIPEKELQGKQKSNGAMSFASSSRYAWR
jgi:hypothetical protein